MKKAISLLLTALGCGLLLLLTRSASVFLLMASLGITPPASGIAGTTVYVALDGRYAGNIVIRDTIKPTAKSAITALQRSGVTHTVMLTGDNEKTAAVIGEQAGVDEVIAGVLPDGKEKVIRDIKDSGKAAMVGDGINDAPAIKAMASAFGFM